jgi:uncharacterized protein with von Willebrand factor type A (vWA) domain
MAIGIDFAMREDNDTSPQQPATKEIRNAMSNALGRDYCYSCIKKIASYMMSVGSELIGEQVAALREENERLCRETGTLNDEKEELVQQVGTIVKENERLRNEAKELNERIAGMKRETLAEDAKKAAVSSNNKKKIGRPPKQAAEEQPAKDEKPKREYKKREPDAGKIVALAAAGWDSERIALDMHMDEDEVKNILKWERQRYQ